VCSAFVQSQKGLGWVPLDWHFDDDGYSGATLDRPAMQGLLKLIRCGAVDRVVVHRLDRLSRSLRDFVFLAQEFRANKVELNVVAAPTLGVTALDNLMLSVLASFAEFEREMTATRIAEARVYLKSKGRRIAGAVPFGYTADARTKQLIVVPEEAEIVSTMFRWAAARVRPSTIASHANAMGWRTRAGNPWTARQVLFTLTNYVYAVWWSTVTAFVTAAMRH
jgi:DNA invertase Pin-like site-specific DNA recombinase